MAGRIRRIMRFVGSLGLMFLGTVTVQADTFTTPYLVEQAKGKAPEVTVYMTGEQMNKKVSVSGTINNSINLIQNGDMVPFNKCDQGIQYIVLVDNSGSVEKKQFDSAKKELASMRKKLGANDRMILYTVGCNRSDGSKKDVMGHIATGNSKAKLSQDLKKIRKIKYYNSKKSKTVLYRSLREVLEANQTTDMRTVILLVTDGEDDSTGKNNDKEVVRKTVSQSTIPVYGVILYNKSHKPNKAKIRYTKYKILDEQNCRGYYGDCSGSKSGKKVAAAFKQIRKILQEKTIVAKLKAPNNKKVDGLATLTVTAEANGSSNALKAVKMNYSAYEEDKTEPVIENIKKERDNAVSFTVKDDSGNVTGADQAANYIVRTKNEKGNGEVWKISSVNYNSVDGKVILTFEKSLYTGDYTLNCTNICDDTQEKNKITKQYTFSFQGLNAGTERTKNLLKNYWWAVVIVLVILIGVVVVIIIRKKPGKIVEVTPVDMMKADTKQICLTITDRTGAIKDVEWNVEGSLFIGRSEMCNIYFDDERLSKQHFVIEVTKVACYIEDLESTNGTFVNGVKVNSKRMLADGDVITAGRETFVFHVQKEEVTAE